MPPSVRSWPSSTTNRPGPTCSQPSRLLPSNSGFQSGGDCARPGEPRARVRVRIAATVVPRRIIMGPRWIVSGGIGPSLTRDEQTEQLLRDPRGQKAVPGCSAARIGRDDATVRSLRRGFVPTGARPSPAGSSKREDRTRSREVCSQSVRWHVHTRDRGDRAGSVGPWSLLQSLREGSPDRVTLQVDGLHRPVGGDEEHRGHGLDVIGVLHTPPSLHSPIKPSVQASPCRR